MEREIKNVAKQFTALMIEKIETMQQQDFTKPWINSNFIPINIHGWEYNGMNRIFLSFLCELRNFRLPVFISDEQIEDANSRIEAWVCDEEKPFPVYFAFSGFTELEADKYVGRYISSENYSRLPKIERVKYAKCFIQSYYNVYNIEQINYLYSFSDNKVLKEAKKYLEKDNIRYDNLTLSNRHIEKMLFSSLSQRWLCPIDFGGRDRGFYCAEEDKIYIPYKTQYKNVNSFYSVLLHEMVHSTGIRKRLNRFNSWKKLGNTEHAKEELVAELASAMIGVLLDIPVKMRRENVMYIKDWLEALRKTPKFVMDVMDEAIRATIFILDILRVPNCRNYLNEIVG